MSSMVIIKRYLPKPHHALYDGRVECEISGTTLVLRAIDLDPELRTDKGGEIIAIHDIQTGPAQDDALAWMAERHYPTEKLEQLLAAHAPVRAMTGAERVKLAERRKRKRGLTQIKLWVPDRPEIIRQLRAEAQRHVDAHEIMQAPPARRA